MSKQKIDCVFFRFSKLHFKHINNIKMDQYVECIFNKPFPIHVINGKDIVQYKDNIEVVVDNIPCRLTFAIWKGFWWFQLEDRDIYENEYFNCFKEYFEARQSEDEVLFQDFDEKNDITPEIIKKFIEVILEKLDTLKFSKKHGQFINKDQCRKQICQKIVFGKFMDTENPDNKCSVCFDHTDTKTPCGHTLCIPCWIKIENKKCPICRNSIVYYNKLNDDDDDDDP